MNRLFYTVEIVLLIAIIPKLSGKKPEPDGRIVGGYETDIASIPYQLSLQVHSHICGASLLSKKWAITAAHCTNGRAGSEFRVRIGSSVYASGGRLVQIERKFQHPSYSAKNTDYDYSLLELKDWDDTGIEYGFVKLPKQNEYVADNTMLHVSGWGQTQNANESNKILRVIEVPKINQAKCNLAYKRFGGLTSRMLCAGFMKGGKDACHGDSGGSLTLKDSLIGIVSWGYGCARRNYPGVYAKVSYVRDWITLITKIV